MSEQESGQVSEQEKEAIEEFKREYNDGTILKSDIIIELNTARIVIDLIDKLQEENKNADERNYSLGLGFIQIGEKLGLENFGIQTILLGIDTLQKENEELEKDKKELFEEYQKRLKEKFDLEQKISNIIENSYNDIDYFNRDMRKDFEDLLKE